MGLIQTSWESINDQNPAAPAAERHNLLLQQSDGQICRMMMTEFRILSLMKSANTDVSDMASPRRRSPTEMCMPSKSRAILAHCVPLPTPGPSVELLAQPKR
ncbi:hypothetical protein U1Q18_052142 [Sarracenia purpurea var. burkii]